SRAFVHFSRIAHVSTGGAFPNLFLRIALHGGTVIEAATPRAASATRVSRTIRARLLSFCQRIPADELAILRRSERTVGSWIAHLRAVGFGANLDHRVAPAPPDQLFRVAAEPRYRSSIRAAAAVAFSASVGPGERERLRAVSTLSPRLRIALDAA